MVAPNLVNLIFKRLKLIFLIGNFIGQRFGGVFVIGDLSVSRAGDQLRNLRFDSFGLRRFVFKIRQPAFLWQLLGQISALL